MSLVIIFILMGIYFGPGAGGPGGAGAVPWQIQRLDRTKSQVCTANRRSLASNVLMAQMDGPMTTDRMQNLISRSAKCPADGTYYFVGETVYCTKHEEIPRFSDFLGI